MPKDLSRTAQEFLAKISTDPTVETMKILLELLEEKIDPDPIELRLLENLYDFDEKLKLLENSVRTYVKKLREVLPGNKLQNLYDETSFDGSSSIFKD